MPVDCSNPTNALGQTAADPCRGPIDCLTDDYNAWVAVVKEEAGLLGLARDRLRAEVLTAELKKEDLKRYAKIVLLIDKVNSFQTNALILKTKPTWLPDVFDIRGEVYKIRDLAVTGCGLLMRAGIELAKADLDTSDLWGKLDIWETAREQAPIRWTTWLKTGGIVLGVVAILGSIGYAATAIAGAKATSPTKRRARSSNPNEPDVAANPHLRGRPRRRALAYPGATCGLRFGTLNALDRRLMPASDFGLPELRTYPMPDTSHAVAAKARATQELARGRISVAQRAEINRRAEAVIRRCARQK
jgi:hypothetical protein